MIAMDMDKRSRSLRKLLNYVREQFYNIGPWLYKIEPT